MRRICFEPASSTRLVVGLGQRLLALASIVAALAATGCGGSTEVPPHAPNNGPVVNESYAPPPSPDDRPDVLFIVIDDVSPQRLGCYGNTVCRTPHMDRFAASGIRFDNAHTSPACNASRSSVLLGLRPATTGVIANADDWSRLPSDVLTMPAHFRSNGYETIRCGKIFHDRRQGGTSWSRVIGVRKGMPPVRKNTRELQGPGADYADEPEASRSEGADGTPFRFGPSGLDDLQEIDGMVAEQAVRLLAEERHGPRFIALGFRAPHLPFTAPDEYFAMYPPDGMVLPQNPGSDESGMPLDPAVLSRRNPHTPEQWRTAIAAHYACISFVDAQIGRVLDALAQSGREHNTIVVIWSDHGFLLGEHFAWRKGGLQEEGTRVVLMMRAPEVTTAGTVCSRPAESVDIFPTLFDLCGIPQPSGIEAISMRPLLVAPQTRWKKGALIWRAGQGRSIVTDRWRLNLYSHAPESTELFDRVKDPREMHNLAPDPSHAETVAELAALLEGGWRACLPSES